MIFDFNASVRHGCPEVLALGLLMVLAGCASSPPVADQSRADRSGHGSSVVMGSARGDPPQGASDAVVVPDAQPKIEPIKPGGPNKPYAVLGQSYQPLAGDVAFNQRGLASWYGGKFHGRRTASGEVYSMYGMTAAHRTLPIPSYARVRHVASGREVIVRINDRGPFHQNRVIDLSYTAANKLGIVGQGVGEVDIERLTFDQIRTGQWRQPVLDETVVAASSAAPASQINAADAQATNQDLNQDPVLALAALLDSARPVASEPAATPSAPSEQQASASFAPQNPPPENKVSLGRAYTTVAKGYWVQLAAFSQRQGVDAFQQRVAQELGHIAPMLAVFNEGQLFRLQVGPYNEREEAQSVAQRVREALQLVPMVVERR